MRWAGYNTEHTLGERDSYHDIGPAWASAAVDRYLHKFFAGEGGAAGALASGSHDGQNVTSQIGKSCAGLGADIVPTVLGLAGVQTSNDFAGKTLVPVLAKPAAGARRGWPDTNLGVTRRGFRAITSWSLIATRSPDWQLFNLRADRRNS